MDNIEELMIDDIEACSEDVQAIDFMNNELYIVDRHIDSVIEESCSSTSIFDNEECDLLNVLSNLIKAGEFDEELTICNVFQGDSCSIEDINIIGDEFGFSDSQFPTIDESPESTSRIPSNMNYGTNNYDSIFSA